MQTVFVVGAFDLLHAGHTKFLLSALSYGDRLVVGVASDYSRRQQKGAGHPLIPAEQRAELLRYIKPVSETIIVDELNIIPVLKRLQPDVFYSLADDWGKTGNRSPQEERFLRQHHCKLVKVEKVFPYLSSAEMADRVADLKIRQVIEYFIGKVEMKPYAGKRSRAQYVNPKIKEAVLVAGGARFDPSLSEAVSLGKLVSRDRLSALGEKLRQQGKTVVFTAMGGDLLHIGHARFLQKASQLGDVLVVGIPSNSSMRRQKGEGRPIIDQQSRAELLAFLRGVDFVTIFDEATVLETLKLLKPDIFQTVDDVWNKDYQQSPEYALVARYGGRVTLCPKQARGISATSLINKAVKIRLRRMFSDCL